MATETTQSLSALDSALLGSSFGDDQFIAVKAEDVQSGSGIDWDKIFFEPQPGNSYLIKFLPNPGGEVITHRSLYRSLPDPQRKGKTFHYVSSGNARTCPALELFFELNSLKKEGDVVAGKKIEKYLGRTNQGCVRVQILQSPVKEQIGQIRLFVFSTFGVNCTIANLINQKINPTKEQIENGIYREDIFNIFESSVLNLVCEEGDYNGVKGRDYVKSIWVPRKRGAIAVLETGESREFKASDLVDGQLVDEAKPYFYAFVEQLKSDNLDVKKQFGYKTTDDDTLDDDTRNYVTNIFEKVNEIIPVIREKSLAEIANYGRKEKSSDSNKKNVTDINEDSLPDELKDSTALGTTAQPKQNSPVAANAAVTTEAADDDDEVNAVLNS